MRTGFQALRKAALAFAYMLPGRWEEIGYPGPLGPRADAPGPRLEPIEPHGELELECDVCVVGSGAGGGVAAAVLAAAGLDVVVLEAGGYWSERDFDGAERTGLRRLYRGGGASATDDQGVGLIAGACLGGGTVVNYSTSFRTPDEVLEEWEGLGFPSAELGPSLDAVCDAARRQHRPQPALAARRGDARGLESLGWHVEAMPRDVVGCEQGVVCGYCGYGCPLGAKQSTLRTWLEDAAAAGARIVVGTKARRVLVENGAAAGVDAGPVQVRSRAVVAAAGAIETPALLLRSGLTNPNVGRGLRLHPATAVFGIFDEEIRPWEGTLQALYSDQHRSPRRRLRDQVRDGPGSSGAADGGGAVGRSCGARPADGEPAAAVGDRRDPARPRRRGVSGSVATASRSRPIASPRTTRADWRPVIDGAGRILAAAGAREVFSANARLQRFSGRLPSGRVPLRPRSRRALLVPHHGLGPHGRLAGHLGGERERARRGRCRTSWSRTARRSRPPPA